MITDTGGYTCRLSRRGFSTVPATKLHNKDIKPELVITDLTDLKKLLTNKTRLKHMPGVYAFKNTINDKQYIGSSKDLYNRLCEHLTGRKSNVALQRAFRKYGKSSFHFYVYVYYKPQDVSGISSLIVLEDYFLSMSPCI